MWTAGSARATFTNDPATVTNDPATITNDPATITNDPATITNDPATITNDPATITDGWVTITGRLGDRIIRSGENISATEVERHLEAHPAVLQAAVVGEPDDRLGERVAAFVVAPAGFGLAECRAWFAERGAARFINPERIEVVEELPVLASGKVDRMRLAASLREPCDSSAEVDG